MEEYLGNLPNDLIRIIFRYVGPPVSPIADLVKSKAFQKRREIMLRRWHAWGKLHSFWKSIEMVQGERWEEEGEFWENIYWEMEHKGLIARRTFNMLITWGNPEETNSEEEEEDDDDEDDDDATDEG